MPFDRDRAIEIAKKIKSNYDIINEDEKQLEMMYGKNDCTHEFVEFKNLIFECVLCGVVKDERFGRVTYTNPSHKFFLRKRKRNKFTPPISIFK